MSSTTNWKAKRAQAIRIWKDMKMDIVIDTLLVIFAVMTLLAVNLVEYAFVSKKMSTINLKTTRALWLFSSALVTVAPFLIPIQINTPEQLGNMKFGFPAYFVEQHFFAANTVQVFPFYTTLANGFGYSLRSAININPLSYATDVFVCYVICAFVFRMLRRIILRTEEGVEVWQG
ncbi:MAG TPA: hypothetical protein VLE49_07380 [Anaerolineales bacterium]|nr:hypothetical protein [Anaerolineales bacterium]